MGNLFVGSKSNLYYCVVGFVAALGFAPVNAFPLFLLALSWLFVMICDDVEKNSNIYAKSFLFFTTLHIATIYWLAYPLMIDLSRHFVLIPFAIIAVPMYFSAQLVASVFLARQFQNTYVRAIVFSSAFCVITYVYGHSSLGFPWVLPAYIWNYHEVFMQTLSLYGPYGFGLVTMILSCMIGSAIVFYKQKDCKNFVISIAIAAAIFSAIVVFGIVRISSNAPKFTERTARIVKCNLSQATEKDDREMSLSKHLTLSANNEKVDFIIWPEAALPFLYREDIRWLHKAFAKILRGGGHLILGAVREDLHTKKIYNSAIFINCDGDNVEHYDKSHLVPFGEYVPFRSIIPETFQSIASDIGDFDVGDSPKVVCIDGLKIATSICYEIAFPVDFLPKDGDPNVIVNLTNDAWFGFTSQPFQHLQIVRARAVETGIPVIRATNYGISAVFDAHGRETARINIDEARYIDVSVPAKTDEPTLYRKYGDRIFWGMLLLLISLLLLRPFKSLTPPYKI